ncbi:phosphatase PAP2 family protein [Mucilaginibacter terrae]|uniref:Membrane-associated phospholipid phosphatase n=1 Tax=Mucilaginibacter terrae TaxID=1955052 RepID=A0ABU3GMH8_9SPHI|nr:phosphatase PAP2 family protein [Mucilaginibacter terrae]MDT3400999.1 membrane-associated phospholipid phosphatase [Mucilaginibacter terrae]
MKFIIFIVLFLLVNTARLSAQIVEKDTSGKNIVDTLKKDLLTAPDTVQYLRSKFISLIPPAALVSYGITSFYARPLRRLDHYIYKEAQEHNISTKATLEDYFQNAPVILVYGLNLAGVHGKNTFIDRTLIFVMAQGMLQLTLNTLKHSTQRLRPNETDRLSFPSGHTGNAFAGAEFMAQEFSGKSVYYGLAGYAFATTTGVFRIYHRDHWLSDVIAGAGFGILATKGAYLLYPYIRNALFKAKEDKPNTIDEIRRKAKTSSSLLLPSYQNGSLGLTFVAGF